MKDRIILDERNHDRRQQENLKKLEQARAEAQTAYEAGDLDDWLEDVADHHDTYLIARCTLDWLDTFLAGKFETMQDAVEYFGQYLPACSIKDFRATRDFVIEQKAELIAEDM